MRETIETAWTELFGEPISRAPGIRIVRDAPNFAERIFLLRLGDGLTIAAPSGIDIDTTITPDEAFTRDFAGSLAPGLVLGPSWHGYADRGSFQPQGPCDARRVTDADGFREHVDAGEFEDGGFGDEPGEYLWYACFEDEERVAMGNMTNFAGHPADVGLVTRPDHRRKGHGTRLAGAMVAEALETLEVVRYRALTTNLASLAVARKLGFVQDGSNIVVRLGP